MNSSRWPSALLRASPPSGSSRNPTRPVSQTADRYIPRRDFHTRARENFLLASPPDDLSRLERKYRKNPPNIDPFGRQPRTTARHQGRPATLTESSNRFTPPSSSRIQIDAHSETRAISQGAVWGLGGPGAAIDGVISTSDGRGGRVASGTNAPMYTSAFLSQREPSEMQDMHEKRLATAFDFDRANKILAGASNTDVRDSTPSSPTNTGSPVSDTSSPTVWRDNQWKKPEVVSRRYAMCPMGRRSLTCIPARKKRRQPRAVLPIIPFR